MTPESIAQKIIQLAEDHLLRDKIICAISKEENTTANIESAKVNQMIAS